jgi:hypothetical protein
MKNSTNAASKKPPATAVVAIGKCGRIPAARFVAHKIAERARELRDADPSRASVMFETARFVADLDLSYSWTGERRAG